MRQRRLGASAVAPPWDPVSEKVTENKGAYRYERQFSLNLPENQVIEIQGVN
jgi:hypothetical protein